jgi:hypothetical protein
MINDNVTGFKAVLYPNSNYTGTPLATIDATSSTIPISQKSISLYGSPNFIIVWSV